MRKYYSRSQVFLTWPILFANRHKLKYICQPVDVLVSLKILLFGNSLGNPPHFFSLCFSFFFWAASSSFSFSTSATTFSISGRAIILIFCPSLITQISRFFPPLCTTCKSQNMKPKLNSEEFHGRCPATHLQKCLDGQFHCGFLCINLNKRRTLQWLGDRHKKERVHKLQKQLVVASPCPGRSSSQGTLLQSEELQSLEFRVWTSSVSRHLYSPESFIPIHGVNF